MLKLVRLPGDGRIAEWRDETAAGAGRLGSGADQHSRVCPGTSSEKRTCVDAPMVSHKVAIESAAQDGSKSAFC